MHRRNQAKDDSQNPKTSEKQTDKVVLQHTRVSSRQAVKRCVSLAPFAPFAICF